ncbi:MAG: hypothetical protein K6F05_01080 [Succinivibrio sp.]|nr:hypothetical protein [Succinivibrio sp.]
MASKAPVYFVGVCLPNEGEPQLTLEIGILCWNTEHSTRPEVYVHSFLQPKLPARVRWSNAEEMGISREMLASRDDLPTIAEIIDAEFLKQKEVVCLYKDEEPIQTLVQNAGLVISVSELWQQHFADNPEALGCQRLSQMLDYLGLPSFDHDNHYYTPLLQQLQALAALWEMLEHTKEGKFKLGKNSQAISTSTIWPLPPPNHPQIEPQMQTLSDLNHKQLEQFFTEDLYQSIDWYHFNIFGNDWVFRRKSVPSTRELSGTTEMADFIYNSIFDLQMKFLTLVYYALYKHKRSYSLEIVLKNGNFNALPAAAREDFSDFLLRYMQDFLSPKQKAMLVRAIVRIGMRERNSTQFEEYDFDTLRKERGEGKHQHLHFQVKSPLDYNVNCYWEIISGAAGATVLFRRYKISGRGQERISCAQTVNQLINEFMQEVKEPFSNFWTDSVVRNWIKFITGISWEEFSRAPKFSESAEISNGRRFLASVITEESRQYRDELHRQLAEFLNLANHGTGNEEEVRRFAFQGVSIEMILTHKPQLPFLKRLFHMS